MRLRLPSALPPALLWVVLVVTAYLTRPLWPVDETRYLSVAWEMWSRGDFLVPYLNGTPYSDKPPLLFWLFHAGWMVFGVNEWWPRLVSPLLSLLNLLLTARLARVLWPDFPGTERCATWLLFGSLLWVAILTLVQFDQLLVLCTLLALLGANRGVRFAPWGWRITGAALGLGLLCKGPVIFVHVLPAVLSAPWWTVCRARKTWERYYAGVLFSVLLGAGIALAWAVPAGIAGGEAYREAIFWSQTTGRLAGVTVHSQPFWWYVPLLPLALLPWTAWPPLWRAVRGFPGLLQDRGIRFCLSWLLPGLLIFSLFSSKQLKYLLPLLPAAALLAARVLDHWATHRRVRLRMPGLLLVVVGLLIASVATLQSYWGLPQWSRQISWIWGGVLPAAGMVLMGLPPLPMTRALAVATAAAIFLAVVVHAGVIRKIAPAYDLSGISARLAALQHAGLLVANVAKYHGQYHFLGRLTVPLPAFLWDDAPDWARRHRHGYLLVYYDRVAATLPEAEYQQDYRGGSLVLWQAGTLLAHPDWLRTLPVKGN